jgi:hypothetical protein
MLAHRSAFSLKTQSVVNAVYDTTLFAIGNRKDAEKCFICVYRVYRAAWRPADTANAPSVTLSQRGSASRCSSRTAQAQAS